MELTAGQIIKSHGIRGDVIIDVHTDEPEQRFAVGRVIALRHTSGTISHHEVVTARWHQQRLLVHFSDINSRDEADALRRCTIIVDSAEIQHVDNNDTDEYHISTLLGMRAFNLEGKEMGIVTDLLTHTAQDLLCITGPDDKEHLVPFMKALVPDVDTITRRLTLDLPEGLWEL